MRTNIRRNGVRARGLVLAAAFASCLLATINAAEPAANYGAAGNLLVGNGATAPTQFSLATPPAGLNPASVTPAGTPSSTIEPLRLAMQKWFETPAPDLQPQGD